MGSVWYAITAEFILLATLLVKMVRLCFEFMHMPIYVMEVCEPLSDVK